MFNIVLVEPEIPQNSGNVVRLCACTNSRLFLVEPLGYSLDDARLKRAGLDYWERAVYRVVPSLDHLLERFDPARFFFFSTKAARNYTSHAFQAGDFLVFGRESRGLDERLLEEFAPQTLTIPMPGRTRSLNLGNSVSIVLYEGLRQVEHWPGPTSQVPGVS
jgi:tRNA (cytidine/uridine-2'-O-)-methyltransferase